MIAIDEVLPDCYEMCMRLTSRATCIKWPLGEDPLLGIRKRERSIIIGGPCMPSKICLPSFEANRGVVDNISIPVIATTLNDV